MGSSICLVIQSIIAFSAWIKMRQRPNVGSAVNQCFTLSFIFSFVFTVTVILLDSPIEWIQLQRNTNFFQFIAGSIFCLFYWSLLMTLLVRLYITFKSSVFRMSTRMIVMFAIILILGSLTSIPSWALLTLYIIRI